MSVVFTHFIWNLSSQTNTPRKQTEMHLEMNDYQIAY